MSRLKVPPVKAKQPGTSAKPAALVDTGARKVAVSAGAVRPAKVSVKATSSTAATLRPAAPPARGTAALAQRPPKAVARPAPAAKPALLAVPPPPATRKPHSVSKSKLTAAPAAPVVPPVSANQAMKPGPRRAAAKAGITRSLASPPSLVGDVVAALLGASKAPSGDTPAARADAEVGAHVRSPAAVLPSGADAGGSATADPAPPSNVDDKPAELSALQPLLALGVPEGLFVVVAAGASAEPVRAFARYEPEPLPRFTGDGGYFQAQSTPAGLAVYTGFVTWPGVPAGALQLGCITASARKPVLSVNSVALADLQPQAMAALRGRFGRVLLPAALAALPPGHALCAALQPLQRPAVPAQAAVRCHFDGAIDGQAHGWVYDPAQPGKAFMVEVLHQGEVVARGMADLYRDDLARNGIGDGCHHFKLNLSYTLFDGQPHALSVRVVELGAAGVCPPVTCTLEASQPAYLDAIPRAQTVALALRLARRSASPQGDAEQAVLAAFEQSCLQQETWQLDEARAGFLGLANTLGENALCHCKVAETLLLDHQLGRAMECYSAALACDPQLPWAHLGLGNVLRMQGQPLAAQQAYRAALACAPGLVQAERRLASVRVDALVASASQLAQAGDKAGAIALVRAVVFEQPDHEMACNSLDALLREQQPGPTGGDGRLPDPASQADRARRLLDAMLDEAEQRLTQAVETP